MECRPSFLQDIFSISECSRLEIDYRSLSVSLSVTHQCFLIGRPGMGNPTDFSTSAKGHVPLGEGRRGGAHQSEMSPVALLCRVVNVQKGKVGQNTPPGRWRLAIWPSGCASSAIMDKDLSVDTHTHTLWFILSPLFMLHPVY